LGVLCKLLQKIESTDVVKNILMFYQIKHQMKHLPLVIYLKYLTMPTAVAGVGFLFPCVCMSVYFCMISKNLYS